MNDDRLAVAHSQLSRMRGMNALYHQRFFTDVWLTTFAIIGLWILGMVLDPRIYLVIPIVALLGANQTAFDASYLTFSRQYATRLEQFINQQLGADVLVGHDMENTYLYPLRDRKIVTIPVGGPLTWFSWMTILYTTLGVGAFVAAVAAGIGSVDSATARVYLLAVALLTLASLSIGAWWFVAGVGERRLEAVLNQRFAL